MNGLIDILVLVFLIACVLLGICVVIFGICLIIADIREDRKTVICDELKKIEGALKAEFGEYINSPPSDFRKMLGLKEKRDEE